MTSVFQLVAVIGTKQTPGRVEMIFIVGLKLFLLKTELNQKDCQESQSNLHIKPDDMATSEFNRQLNMMIVSDRPLRESPLKQQPTAADSGTNLGCSALPNNTIYFKYQSLPLPSTWKFSKSQKLCSLDYSSGDQLDLERCAHFLFSYNTQIKLKIQVNVNYFWSPGECQLIIRSKGKSDIRYFSQCLFY